VKPEVAVVVAVESGGWKIVVIIGKNGVAVWIVDSGETTSGSGAVGVVPIDAAEQRGHFDTHINVWQWMPVAVVAVECGGWKIAVIIGIFSDSVDGGRWRDNEWQWLGGSGVIRFSTSMRSFWYPYQCVAVAVVEIMAVECGDRKVASRIGKILVAVWIVGSGETTSGSGWVVVVPFDAERQCGHFGTRYDMWQWQWQ
jgi:hypothetical protein